ncbi:(2Fe-2S)-binding [Chlorella sorokiniana]|uniref:(2Fe-2S)-binding n=1 Tax=Chlorella sorokiniana TaxID=3076 RepID=A0A2P6TCW6_CHLSO|nr:(2Fe-2S)-binding [Chlorella sorokiniana]|eukprot:PRW20476.1 (2Fe-2S)-binding [Chlorella sorokiniana]
MAHSLAQPLPAAAAAPLCRRQQAAAARQQRAALPRLAAAAAAEKAAVPVTFSIGGSEVTVDAQPGQNIWEVAKDAGVDITLGCSQGSCGVCEVEVWKYSSGDSSGSNGVARACIAGIPPGYQRLEIREMAVDDFWSVDGYDT